MTNKDLSLCTPSFTYLSDILAERLALFNTFFWSCLKSQALWEKQMKHTSQGRNWKKTPTTPIPLQNHKEIMQAKLSILFVCLFLPKMEKRECL